MAKKTEGLVEKSFWQKVKSFFKWLVVLALVLVVIGVALMHPKVRSYYEQFLEDEDAKEIVRVDNELGALTEKVDRISTYFKNITIMTDDVELLKERFGILEQNNINTINSKADVNLVLGIIGRLDGIENKVNEVAKVSDRGALVATAVMLVKDRAASGGDFVYEMNVLEQLTSGEQAISPYVKTLSKYAGNGVYSEAFLVSEFEKIYRNFIADEDEEEIDESDWRAKFNKKFGKIMTIKYRKTNEAEEQEELGLEQALYYMKSGEFVRAVQELNREKYKDMVGSSPVLTEWLNYANDRIEFDNAISKISAYSLAAMKANEYGKNNI